MISTSRVTICPTTGSGKTLTEVILRGMPLEVQAFNINPRRNKLITFFILREGFIFDSLF
jgi:hypothetical protein